MIPEDKELLLKDLCARLPYGVKVNLHNEIYTLLGYYDDYVMLTANVPTGQQTNIVNIKPYLRPMSSMTEDEKKVYDEYYFSAFKIAGWDMDFYNAHHLDYRGLIEMGIALKAPEDMYES